MVQYWVNPIHTTSWVITLGSISPGLGPNLCIDNYTCAMFAVP
eukprot:COSAG02_NODE_51939_length_311_cov_0.584906_1_plen_42_part_01